MTNYEQRIAIAKACGVKPLIYEWWVHSDKERVFCMSGTKQECESFMASLPSNSPYRSGDWEIAPCQKYPDYLEDLNAMHEAEKVLTTHQRIAYQSCLGRVGTVDPYVSCWDLIHATARQRCEAFLKTLELWKE